MPKHEVESLMPYVKPHLLSDKMRHSKGSKYGLTHYQIHSHYVAGCPLCLALSKDWRCANKKIHNEICHQYRNRVKTQVIELLGGKCVGCGATDPRILTVNHKNGDGAKWRKLNSTKSSYNLYRRALKGKIPIDTIDLRCYNCNILYEYESGRRRW